MNFVAGFLLLISDGNEEESFQFFASMLTHSRYPLAGLYENGFPLLGIYIKSFETLFSRHLPGLKSHLDTHSVPCLLWLTKWLHTLFLYSFPFILCIRVWDHIISNDYNTGTGSSNTSFIFKFTLAVLKKHEEEIMAERDLVGINDVLNGFLIDED